MEYELESILLTLENILKEVKPRKNLEEGLPQCDEYDYTENYAAYCKIAREEIAEKDSYVSNILDKALESHIAKYSDATPFNICSIGCGAGEADRIMLQNVSVPVNYVGIEINEKSSHMAKATLKDLPLTQVTIINEDFMQMDLDSLSQFDLVLMVHVHYYIKDLKIMFGRLQKVAKENAKIVIISLNLTAKQKIWGVFFEKEWKFPCRYAQDLLQVLDEIGVRYSSEDLPNKGVWHLDRCFKEDFSSQFSKNVLDFIYQTALKNYPQEVINLCVKYLHACCRKTPESDLVFDYSINAIILEN